jgi:hypothetical protein
MLRWEEFTRLGLYELGTELESIFKVEDAAISEILPLHREFCSDGVLICLQNANSRAIASNRPIGQSDIALVSLRDSESAVSQSLAKSGLNPFDLATLLESAEQCEKAAKILV